MQGHSAIGEIILERVDHTRDVARVVRHHHERIDGEGYPDQLAGAKFRSCRKSSQ